MIYVRKLNVVEVIIIETEFGNSIHMTHNEACELTEQLKIVTGEY